MRLLCPVPYKSWKFISESSFFNLPSRVSVLVFYRVLLSQHAVPSYLASYAIYYLLSLVAS